MTPTSRHSRRLWPASTRLKRTIPLLPRGHLKTQEATLRANQDLLNRTIAVAPFDGVVTNEPVREGETVVDGHPER